MSHCIVFSSEIFHQFAFSVLLVWFHSEARLDHAESQTIKMQSCILASQQHLVTQGCYAHGSHAGNQCSPTKSHNQFENPQSSFPLKWPLDLNRLRNCFRFMAANVGCMGKCGVSSCMNVCQRISAGILCGQRFDLRSKNPYWLHEVIDKINCPYGGWCVILKFAVTTVTQAKIKRNINYKKVKLSVLEAYHGSGHVPVSNLWVCVRDY